MLVGECILDKERTLMFEEAILKTVKDGMTVLDAGSGTGILALFSARAGASRVYSIEIDDVLAGIISDNAHSAGYGDVIEVVNQDMKELSITEPVDVVTMEMLDTGMIAEQQVQAINTLVDNGVITPSTVVIPNRCKTYVEFGYYDFDFYGFDMPFIVQARNFLATQKMKYFVSDKIEVADIDLTVKNDTKVETAVTLSPLRSASVNCIVISSQIDMGHGIETFGTTDMNMPVVVPIDPIEVEQGKTYKFKISYDMGYGFGGFEIKSVH